MIKGQKIRSENLYDGTKQFEKIMWHIIRSIEKAGYDAEEQITAFLLTGTDSYITR